MEQIFSQSVNTLWINVLYPIFTRFHVTVEITSTLNKGITIRTAELFEERVDIINIANLVVVAQ